MRLTLASTLKPLQRAVCCSRHRLPTANNTCSMTMAHDITVKLQFATTCAISAQSIGWTAGIIGCLGLLAIPFGFTTGLFFVQGDDISWRHTILLSIRLLFVPSTLEEYLWRVILQPYPTEGSSIVMRVLFCTISTLAFVAAHPLLANTVWTRGRTVFEDWRFLILTFLLGIACTLAYQLSGSVWMPVVVHWTAVVAWIAFLEGEERLLLAGEK